jgi:hypothetical protein
MTDGCQKSLREEATCETQVLDGRIIVKCILHKYGVSFDRIKSKRLQ